MKKKPLIAATVCVAAIALPAAVMARPQTTTPGVVYVVKTPVDDKGIHIPKDQFTRNGITRYPRVRPHPLRVHQQGDQAVRGSHVG